MKGSQDQFIRNMASLQINAKQQAANETKVSEELAQLHKKLVYDAAANAQSGQF